MQDLGILFTPNIFAIYIAKHSSIAINKANNLINSYYKKIVLLFRSTYVLSTLYGYHFNPPTSRICISNVEHIYSYSVTQLGKQDLLKTLENV